MQATSLIEQIQKRGYTVPDIIIPSKELLNIKDLIDTNNTSTILPQPRKLRYVLTRSRDFLDSHFQIKEVPYYHETKIGPLCIEKYGTIHPYGLPITRIKGEDSFYGSLREVLDFQDGIITKQSYKGIELAKKTTDLSALSYTHEITHSQLNHVKGLIADYSNIEFLSIFLETLQSYETSDKLLRIHDSERLSELAGIINELEKYHTSTEEDIKAVLVEGSSYAESTLKAYNLFIRYYNSFLAIRKEILNDIQKIFNQEISVEDFLTKHEITFDNSQNVKSLSNYLRR